MLIHAEAWYILNHHNGPQLNPICCLLWCTTYCCSPLFGRLPPYLQYGGNSYTAHLPTYMAVGLEDSLSFVGNDQ